MACCTLRALTRAVAGLSMTIAGLAFAADGAPVPSFADDGLAIASAGDVYDGDGRRIEDQAFQRVPNAVQVTDDGSIVIGGSLNLVTAGRPDPNMLGTVTRLDADGAPDAGFGRDDARPGLVVLPDLVPGTREQRVEAVHVLPDGGIVAVGTATAFGPTSGFVVKLLPNGDLDPDFAHGGAVLRGAQFHDVAIDSRGHLLVAGERIDASGGPLYRGMLARFDAAGALLGTHDVVEPDSEHMGFFDTLRVLPDDRVVLAGSLQQPPPEGALDNYDFSVARLTADGAPDPSFAGDGWAVFAMPGTESDVENILRMEIDAAGGIVFAAQVGVDDDRTTLVLGRLSSDGSIDERFGDAATPGFARADLVPSATNFVARGLAQARSGHWFVSGYYAGDDVFNNDFVVARFGRDGVLDRSFGDAGIAFVDLMHGDWPTDDVRAMTLHRDQPLLVGASMRVHLDGDPSTPISPPAVDTAVLKLSHSPLFADDFSSP